MAFCCCCFVWGFFKLFKKQVCEYINVHQNMLVSGQEAFGESQAAEECGDFSLPNFVSEGKKE